MENPIPTRIFEFLKDIPPFTLMSKKDLSTICEKVIIQYVQPSEVIFEEGAHPNPFIYIVHDGAVHLKQKVGNEDVLVEQCDEGELFGLRPIVADDQYQLSAIAEEETLLYKIKVDDLKHYIQDHPEITWYLAKSFAAGRYSKPGKTSLVQGFENDASSPVAEKLFVNLLSKDYSKSPIVCGPGRTIFEAAKKMRDFEVGSMIVVNKEQEPIGIFTDRDLRNRVVTGEIPNSSLVSDIMSSTVITIPPNSTIADVQIKMMQYKIHHLVITETGDVDSRVVGVISEHDLLVLRGIHPAVFVREIQRCMHADDLKMILDKTKSLLYQYLTKEVPIRFISRLITQVYDALTMRAIELCTGELVQNGLSEPDIPWCWTSLGSAGRAEQLIRTDQDHAIIFAQVPDHDYKKTQEYFVSLAKKVVSVQEHCGFQPCPANMMASNEKWCMSIDKWKDQFSSWINQPTDENVMFCTIFFDYRPLFGSAPLIEELSEHIQQCIKRKEIFLNFLAKQAVQTPPPLTFFRSFMVEKSGAHKDAFDIKARAMMPLSDAARVLTLASGTLQIQNTMHRFMELAEQEPQNRELFEQACDAYGLLMRYRAIQGLKNKDDGRYFDPSKLTRMERLNLRNCFRPIRDLQELLQVRYQLSILM